MKKDYHIDFGTGEIHRGEPAEKYMHGLVTRGYKTAQSVSRLVKKGELDQALKIANEGLRGS
jgi:hypothetical protein